MFSRLFVGYSCLSTALTALAAAQTSTITASGVQIAAPTATTISQCPTGDAQCCNTVSKASSSPSVGLLLGLLDIALSNPDDVVVGVICSPITDIGVGQGPSCSQQPVCCSNNSFNGLIAIGCTPISL